MNLFRGKQNSSKSLLAEIKASRTVAPNEKKGGLRGLQELVRTRQTTAPSLSNENPKENLSSENQRVRVSEQEEQSNYSRHMSSNHSLNARKDNLSHSPYPQNPFMNYPMSQMHLGNSSNSNQSNLQFPYGSFYQKPDYFSRLEQMSQIQHLLPEEPNTISNSICNRPFYQGFSNSSQNALGGSFQSYSDRDKIKESAREDRRQGKNYGNKTQDKTERFCSLYRKKREDENQKQTKKELKNFDKGKGIDQPKSSDEFKSRSSSLEKSIEKNHERSFSKEQIKQKRVKEMQNVSSSAQKPFSSQEKKAKALKKFILQIRKKFQSDFSGSSDIETIRLLTQETEKCDIRIICTKRIERGLKSFMEVSKKEE